MTAGVGSGPPTIYSSLRLAWCPPADGGAPEPDEEGSAKPGRRRLTMEQLARTVGVGATAPHSVSPTDPIFPPRAARRGAGCATNDPDYSAPHRQLAKRLVPAIFLILAAVCGLFVCRNAHAASPVSPADGATITTGRVVFDARVNNTNGESDVVVHVQTVAGNPTTCAAQRVGSGPNADWQCTLSGLTGGRYTWYLSSSVGSSGSRSFTVSGATAVTTTTTSTSTTSTTATTSSSGQVAKGSPEQVLVGRSVRHAGVRVGPIRAAVCLGKRGRYTCVARAGNATRLFRLVVSTSPKLGIKWSGWVT